MDKQKIQKILEAAAKAPSGDNMQPWSFEILGDGSEVALFNLPEKDDSYYNYQQKASYIAHGAVLENIVIAAQQLGAGADIELFPESLNPDLVAKIKFSPQQAQEHPLYPAIFSRNTNRFFFKQQPIAGDVISQMLEHNNNDSLKLYLETERQKIQSLAKILKINDRLVFEIKSIHSFLFDKIRWNKQQVESTQDGMPIGTLGLTVLEQLFFPLLKFWHVVKAFNGVGLSRIVGLKGWIGSRNASMLGMISMKSTDNRAFVESGRLLQRIWLESAKQGLAFQPVIGLSLLIYRAENDALSELSFAHRQLILKARSALIEFFNLDSSEFLVTGFRIGAPIKRPVSTLRRPIR